jgi:hypothetical protein
MKPCDYVQIEFNGDGVDYWDYDVVLDLPCFPAFGTTLSRGAMEELAAQMIEVAEYMKAYVGDDA